VTPRHPDAAVAGCSSACGRSFAAHGTTPPAAVTGSTSRRRIRSSGSRGARAQALRRRASRSSFRPTST